MGKYISKSAAVAEIEKIKEGLQRNGNPNPLGNLQECLAAAEIEALNLIKDSLDSLELKEVDLQSEIDRVWDNTSNNFLEDGWKEFEDFAKHFFELGLLASNPLSWEDMLIIHRCIKDAMNYHLYAFQSVEGQQKVYEEVLKRFKALKGEKV